MLLLVVNQPHAIRIEVGYGLEGAITDALSGRVIRSVMTPAFRAGDYPAGIERAFGMLMTAANGGVVALGDEWPTGSAAPSRPRPWRPAILLFALIFLVPIAAVIVLAGFLILFNKGGRLTRGGHFWVSGGGPSSSGGSSSGQSGSSGGSGFSGGGGSFGGGGASGSW